MKPKSVSVFSKSILPAVFCVAISAAAHADVLTWNAGTSNNWNTSEENWSGDIWDNSAPDSAIFDTAGVGIVTLTQGISVDDIAFDTAGFTITGDTLTILGSGSVITANADASIASVIAGGNLVKQGSATLSLSGSNSYNNGTVIENGTLEITSIDGATSNVGSAWLAMDNSSTLRYIGTGSESTTRDFWINNAAGTRTFDIVDAGATLSLASGGGSITRDIQKSGDGTLALGRATSSGNTTVSDGVLEVTSTGKLYGTGYTTSPTITVASTGTLRLNGWSWDAAGSIANLDYSRERLVVNGGTIEYTGASNFNPGDPGSSSRNLTIGTGGTTLKASSAAGQTWTLHSANGNLINDNGLTLDGAGAGEIQKVIEGTGSLTKTGVGTWTLSGSNTYTGNTLVNAGELSVTSTGSLRFGPTTNGATNSVSGTSSASLSFVGTVDLDLSAANTAGGNIWNLFNLGSFSGPAPILNPAGVSSGLGSFIEGTPGTWELNVTGAKWVFTEADGNLTYVVTATDYDTWKSANGVTGGPGADDDNDGLTNFEEYAFGLDPTGGSSVNPITGQLNKTNGTFTYQRRDNGLTGLDYTVWYSTDLNVWLQDSTAQQVEGALDGNGVEVITVTLSNAPGNPLPGKLFIQVRAE